MGAYWKKYGTALLRLKPVESVLCLTVTNGWWGTASDETHAGFSIESGTWEGEYLKTVQKSTNPYGLNIYAQKKGKYIYKTNSGYLQIGEFEAGDLIAFYQYTGSAVYNCTVVIALAECTTPVNKNYMFYARQQVATQTTNGFWWDYYNHGDITISNKFESSSSSFSTIIDDANVKVEGTVNSLKITAKSDIVVTYATANNASTKTVTELDVGEVLTFASSDPFYTHIPLIITKQ